MEELNCHMCGETTEFTCEDCGEPVCDNCAVPFTLQNQYEGTHCECCYSSAERLSVKEFQAEEDLKGEKEKKRKKKNEAARARYHSPKQIKRRLLAKIAREIERQERIQKHRKEVSAMMKDFGF